MHLLAGCRIHLLLAVIACGSTTSCFADGAVSDQNRSSLTSSAILHTVECANPRRELCVIRKPVGSGYRMLTQGVVLEDTGDYWLADFTKRSKNTKQPDPSTTSFRVLGKDNDLHEVEITFLDKKPAKLQTGKNKSIRVLEITTPVTDHASSAESVKNPN